MIGVLMRDEYAVNLLRPDPQPAHLFGQAVVIIARVDHGRGIALPIEE